MIGARHHIVLALAILSAGAAAAIAAAPLRVQLPEAGAVARAEAEAAAAARTAERLERTAREARDSTQRFAALRLAAAQDIAEAEARISAADARLGLLAGQLAAGKARLAQRQEPAGALLAGIALMADRPPIVALLSSGSVEDLVRVRMALDSTLPVIRDRVADLRGEVERLAALQARARKARTTSERARQELEKRRTDFAALETRAAQIAEQQGARALESGDSALAASERAQSLRAQRERSAAARSAAARLARLPAAPPRPGRSARDRQEAGLDYRMPSSATVVEGFAEVSRGGIRTRGITLATARGDVVTAPASGTIRFAGPFRQRDGVVLIDHGQGWTSLLVNVVTTRRRGSRVVAGQPIGRATGAMEVELSRNGERVSPALIAGSSAGLSNGIQAQ